MSSSGIVRNNRGFDPSDAEGGVRDNGADDRGGAGAEETGGIDGGGDVDLFARTWESLDFGVVLKRLSRECRTEMGQRRALVPDFKTDLEEVCVFFLMKSVVKIVELSFHHLMV